MPLVLPTTTCEDHTSAAVATTMRVDSTTSALIARCQVEGKLKPVLGRHRGIGSDSAHVSIWQNEPLGCGLWSPCGHCSLYCGRFEVDAGAAGVGYKFTASKTGEDSILSAGTETRPRILCLYLLYEGPPIFPALHLLVAHVAIFSTRTRHHDR